MLLLMLLLVVGSGGTTETMVWLQQTTPDPRRIIFPPGPSITTLLPPPPPPASSSHPPDYPNAGDRTQVTRPGRIRSCARGFYRWYDSCPARGFGQGKQKLRLTECGHSKLHHHIAKSYHGSLSSLSSVPQPKTQLAITICRCWARCVTHKHTRDDVKMYIVVPCAG
ncbi:uncharacterized protein LOC120897246 [Anopheles arabiensis]|uniref:uncharacterized protein LOC120897246 n=1 Tax=Anopheles arabiensis TaxID=7173 RepID=UPI001AACEA6A|nr:uncharacterized protein LOC120897246 [Anopheles arabiensis]